MLTLLFFVFCISMLGHLVVWAIKASWGILKIMFGLVLLPIALLVLACYGLAWLAFVLWIPCAFIAALFKSGKNSES